LVTVEAAPGNWGGLLSRPQFGWNRAAKRLRLEKFKVEGGFADKLGKCLRVASGLGGENLLVGWVHCETKVMPAQMNLSQSACRLAGVLSPPDWRGVGLGCPVVANYNCHKCFLFIK